VNDVESRTREALHEAVDEVVVSDHDVARMEADLLSSLAGPRWSAASGGALSRRRRRWGLAAAAVAVAAAVAGGLALSADDPEAVRPAGAPVSDRPLVPPELVGLWRNVPQSPWLWEFTSDGRMGVTQTSSGYLSGETVAKTITRRDGDRYLTVDPTDACSTEFRVTFTSVGAVVTVLSGTCVDDWGGAEYDVERLWPGSVGPQALEPRYPKAAAAVRMNGNLLDGTWLHAESRTLLVIGARHAGSSLTYVMDDDGDGSTDPDQRGVLSLGADGAVRARPTAGDDRGCAPQFTTAVTDSATMTTTAGAGGCVPIGGQQTWIRLN